MDPIQVPAPPRAAYNPNRRVSDLLLGQLKHFQHVEQKHGKLGIDPALARDIHTEAGAARYITAITRALRKSGAAQPAPATNLTAMPVSGPAEPSPQPGLAIAASAEGLPLQSAVKNDPGLPEPKSRK